MQSSYQYHVRVTVKTPEDKTRSYIYNDAYYAERSKAVEAGAIAFDSTDKVMLVEVFQAQVANPVALFQ